MFKKLLRLAVLAAFAGASLAGAAESSFPDKPIYLIVPYPAGGSTDVLARTLGERVSKSLGQPVIVENRAGASGNIGAAYVARAPADGYTLFLGTSTALAVNPSLYKQLPYNPQKDFVPIILATMLPSIVVVNGASPIHTMKELTEALKQDAKFGTYASAGNGTPAHLGGELYKRMAGVQASHVPYKGGAPALNDLMGGQTKYMFAILPEAMPLVKSGKLRALAVTTAARLPAYPDLPTVSESGVPGFELIGWYGFLAPANTRADIVAKLNEAFAAALKENDVRDRLRALGFEIVGGAPSALTDLMRSETVKWRKVIQDGNITVD